MQYAPALEVSELALAQKDIAICYETNGNISSKWLNRMATVVKRSGETIKIDLKAFTSAIYTALTGSRNEGVFRNSRSLAAIGRERVSEFLVASIILVPGYVDAYEIRKLSEFIADCDSTIPTSFLGFVPQHHMRDLPPTSRQHAFHAREIAFETGHTNVHIGNMTSLSEKQYYVG